MKNIAHGLFQTGEMYSDAAVLLNTNVRMTPGIVVGALALELYFKALYILDKGQEFKIDGRHSHDFLAIFDQLQSKTRVQLIAEFDAEVKRADLSFIKTVKNEVNVVVSLDLRQNVDQWHDVFVKVRYLHEFNKAAKGTKRYWAFFSEMERAIKKVCFEKEPEWMI